MTNGDAENPMGTGYDISHYPSLYHTTYRTAKDMWALLSPRINNLEEHGIRDNRIGTLKSRGEEALRLAGQALQDKKYDIFSEESTKSCL